MRIIKPQAGFQTDYLSNGADILIGGGMAGLGKSFALLYSIIPYIKVRGFTAVAFRRTTPMITNEGGLLTESQHIYAQAGGTLKLNPIRWSFNNGDANISFTHLQHERNADDHKGAQYAGILFDELTHFTKRQFLGIVSRNRSTCGIRPFTKATCNPDPDSFVYDYVKWYLDADGFPDKERVGKIRYMYTKSNTIIWGNTPQEVFDQEPDEIMEVANSTGSSPANLISSFSFVTGKLMDNQELLSRDPQYVAKLASLPENEKLRLMYGCWRQSMDSDALIDFEKIRAIYDYEEPKHTEQSYITLDVARFGRDWAVLCVFKGYHVIAMEIWTKCSLDILHERVLTNQVKHNIPSNRVIVDEGGVGGGIIDYGAGFIGFVANATPINGEQYQNLKAQLHYVFADKVNEGLLKIDTTSIRIDGKSDVFVMVGGSSKEVRQLINEQLKSIKRKKGSSSHDKKSLISKDEQKQLISTSSPDLADALVLRAYFDLRTEKPYYKFDASRIVKYNLLQEVAMPVELAFHPETSSTFSCVVSQIKKMNTNLIINVLAIYYAPTIEELIATVMKTHHTNNITTVRYYMRPSLFMQHSLSENSYKIAADTLRKEMRTYGIPQHADNTTKKTTSDIDMHRFANKILEGESGITIKVDTEKASKFILELNTLRANSDANMKIRTGTSGMLTDAFFGMCRTIFEQIKK